MTRPPHNALAPYLPPPPDLTALSDADLALYLEAMGHSWNDGSSAHAYRLMLEAAERLGGRNG